MISGLSVGHDHSGAGRAQHFGGDGGGSCETDHEVRERGGDERPNPRLRGSLFERLFVAMNDGCLDLVVTGGQRDGHSRLLLDAPAKTAWHAEQCVESQRGARFRLAKQALQTAVTASSLGSDVDSGTPSGSSARVVTPPHEHVQR